MATTPLSITDFAAKLRAKYPGSYDSLSDPQLVQKVVTKYPDYKEHVASFAETQFEKDRDQNNQGGALPAIGATLGKAASGLVGAAASAFDSPGERAAKAASAGADLALSDQDRKQSGRSVPYRIAAGIGQGTGIADPVTQEKAADVGDTAGVLGSAGTSAAIATSPYIAKGLGAAREGIGSAIHDPETMALRPGAKATAQIGGAAIGGAAGLIHDPYAAVAGAGAGYRLGPSMMEGMFPAPPPKPVFPGAPFPTYEDFAANKAAEVMAMRKLQPDAFSAPKPQLGTPENPDFYSKLPSRLPPNLRGDPFSPNPPAPAPTAIGDIPSEEGVKGSLPKPSGRLVLLPQEAAAAEQMQRIAKARASAHGMQYAAGMRPAGGGRVPMSPTSTITPEIPSMTPEMLADLKARLGLQ